MSNPSVQFHVRANSGVAAYMQLIQQVRHALRLGVLVEGDQLPTVKEVAALVAVNPNTVLKAYRELEYEGLVQARPGLGTFVTASLPDATVVKHEALARELGAWIAQARAAGLDDEGIEALFMATMHGPATEADATEAKA
jgi:GntR family transcriptional regulator